MIYQISSGLGPDECQLGVAKFLEYLQSHYKITVLNYSEGHHWGTYRSVKLYSPDDLSQYLGSIQWICQSQYRPKHKRKNWFLDFSECGQKDTVVFDKNQVSFETFRSGGNGGQNINKVETGVRAIYSPLGISVTCTEERSQYLNKQKAIQRLENIINQENELQRNKERNETWQFHTKIVRGNAAIKFCGAQFKPKHIAEMLPS